MIDPRLISDSIPPLQSDDTVEHVITLLHEYGVSQLPVLEGKKYLGVVALEDLIQWNGKKTTLQETGITFRRAFVLKTAHIFDVMRLALEFNVRIVPVINEGGHYFGLISAESCMRAFALMNSVKDQGAIIELEIPLKDFTLSEIAHIVEDNECRILCLYTNINQHQMTVEITFKVNTTDINALVASFERYEYVIKAVHNDMEYTEGLKDRYDALMRYLNV